MFKRLSMAGCAMLVAAGPAHAANCPAHPYTFTNGNNADATQVMADFNNLLNCSNANLAPKASPSFTGNVTVAAPTSGYALDVAGIGRFVSPNNGTSGGVVIRDTAGDPDSNYIQFVNNANTAQYGYIKGLKATGLLLAGGNVGVGGINGSFTFYVNGAAGGLGAWTNVSDARLKTNIVPLTGALALVEQIQGVRFNWKPAADRSIGTTMNLPVEAAQIGFVAQDLEKVVPEAVTRPQTVTDTYGVQEGTLVPLLVEAIKEQQAEIQQLRALLAQIAASK